MKKFLVTMGLVAFAFVGCDDSSSASVGPNDEPGIESSSSSSGKVTEPVEVTSSSSDKTSVSSSSSVDDQSSSSVTLINSSGSVKYVSSSSLVVPDGWSWDIPKEMCLNSEITYGTMTDERDGKTYKTVVIAPEESGYSREWMAENLNYADSVSTPSLKGKSWCYDSRAENCAVAGRLYTWAAAIDSVALYDSGNGVDCGDGKTCTLPEKVQGVCPSGWHLPTDAEWKTLFDEVGGQSNAGKVLKSQTGWYSNGGGTDAYGFSALPAGNWYYAGLFLNDGRFALFWSATEYSISGACRVYLYYGSDVAYLDDDNKYYGFSVRCVKD